MCIICLFSIDDEPPGEEKGGGDLAKNVAESVTTINSSEDGIDDGIILFVLQKEHNHKQHTHFKNFFATKSVSNN